MKVELFKRTKITIDEDIPNVTKSERESNWEPSFDFIFNNLAKKPSKKSHNIPNKTNKAKVLRSPFNP